MTLDPKRLNEAALGMREAFIDMAEQVHKSTGSRVRRANSLPVLTREEVSLYVAEKVLAAYGVPELEACAAIREERIGFLESCQDKYEAEIAALKAELARFEWRPESGWQEDVGPAIWARFPITEPFYAGCPLSDDWLEDYYTHFIPMSVLLHTTPPQEKEKTDDHRSPPKRA